MNRVKKNRKRVAAAGIAVASVMGGGIAGILLGPTSAGAASGSTSTTATAAGAPARPNDAAVAAGVLGMSEADVRSALQSGKSLSQLATEKNVDVQKVIDAIKAADTAALKQAVPDGKLPQAQADEMKANLDAHVKDEVNRTGGDCGGPGAPGGHHGHGPGDGGPDGAPAAPATDAAAGSQA